MPASKDDVLLELARAVVGISTHAADQLGRRSVVQLRALTVLRGLQEANLGRLAAELGVTVPTASRLVDRLAAAGLVDRRTSRRSRRELALTVSDEGRGLLERYDVLRLVELRSMLDRVPEDRRRHVLAALGEFAGVPGAVTVL